MLKHSRFVVALAVVATTAYAAAEKPWTHSDIVQANNLFGDKSGLRFTVDPPDPEHPEANQVLRVHGTVVGGLDQVVAITTDNPDPKYPPGPCFKAMLTDPLDPEAPSVVVHVLHPTEVRFVDANGQPLELVAP